MHLVRLVLIACIPTLFAQPVDPSLDDARQREQQVASRQRETKDVIWAGGALGTLMVAGKVVGNVAFMEELRECLKGGREAKDNRLREQHIRYCCHVMSPSGLEDLFEDCAVAADRVYAQWDKQAEGGSPNEQVRSGRRRSRPGSNNDKYKMLTFAAEVGSEESQPNGKEAPQGFSLLRQRGKQIFRVLADGFSQMSKSMRRGVDGGGRGPPGMMAGAMIRQPPGAAVVGRFLAT